MRYGWTVALVLALAGSGCASRKFVRSRVDPVVQRVNSLEGQSREHARNIEELDDAVSLADERAITADQKAEQAALQARQAGERADQAGQTASSAQALAERGHSRIDSLGRVIENWDDYRLSSEANILFRFGSAALDEEAKRQLDRTAATVPPNGRRVIEVRGFTDATGNAAYNLALSERRARAVVRYLVTRHGVPLRQIHMLGVGSEDPRADNGTREGRRQNRRVEVAVYVAGQAELTALK